MSPAPTQTGRLGQSTPNATHLIKVAVQAALGLRPGLEVFGTDYPTRDGTCIRDYIQVSDLVAAHLMALDHLRKGGERLHLQLRLWPWRLGVRSRRCRQASIRRRFQGADFRPPSWRSGVARRGYEAHKGRARLDAKIRRSSNNRRSSARLGAPPARQIPHGAPAGAKSLECDAV